MWRRLEMRRGGNDPAMTTESAARELREELGEIAAVEGCAGCERLFGVAAQALADLRRLPGDEARDAEADARRLLAAGAQALHGCIECDPCLPVGPYRRFRAALAAADVSVGGGVEPGRRPHRRADDAARGCPGCARGGCS